ncbi:MAG: hypothetical protein GXO00_02350 [Candidatus Diapherotrites archaeon]|nr:hypothetical protein [Candidatus Diapherotrites archaeon]
MRGDIGISTLIIFIVIVLIATVAAIVLLNAANSLKNQAQITQQESQAKFARRLEILSIYGFVDKNANSPTYNRIKYLRITARVPSGGEYVDLTNTVLEFSTGNVIKTATFIDAGDADNNTPGDPCEKTDQRVWEIITTGVWIELGKSDAYYRFNNGDYYTVAWVLCNGETDDTMVFPGQLINIYYAPPDGLLPEEQVRIALIVNKGGKTEVEFTVPDVFRGSVVKLYPP